MIIRELMEKRANLIKEARDIVEKAEAEDRGLDQEESNRYDELMADVLDMTERIQRAEALENAESEMGKLYGAGNRPEPEPEDNRAEPYKWRCRGMREMADENMDLRAVEHLMTPEANRAFGAYLRGVRMSEQRALQADSDVAGGFLYAPMQFVDRLIQAVDDNVYMRQWATVFAVTDGESLGAPSLDNDPADPNWTSELNIGDEDSTMTFGQRELTPHPLAQYIKVSRKLLRKAPSITGLVTNRLGYKQAVVQENAFLNGSGVGEPLGVFVASNSGISTGQDYSTGNTTTEMRFDGLIGAKYTLKVQYWPRARWLFHRDGQAQIAKLKDGNGQYLWRESVRVGEPDTVLGFPTFMSEYAPSTFTTGLYVGLLGDWSHYWIADSLLMEIQRLNELYAATNQVGFITRSETDGMPVLEEAFVRVKLA